MTTSSNTTHVRKLEERQRGPLSTPTDLTVLFEAGKHEMTAGH